MYNIKYNVYIINKIKSLSALPGYHKSTHTNRYLHSGTHHCPAKIKWVANNLIQRTKALSDKEHIYWSQTPNHDSHDSIKWLQKKISTFPIGKPNKKWISKSISNFVSDCDKVYIGQSNKNIAQKEQEHKSAWRNLVVTLFWPNIVSKKNIILISKAQNS